tara:strand:- start:153 stop:368 length:216 start_codon:yes stop_codon:yes gene_type:complete
MDEIIVYDADLRNVEGYLLDYFDYDLPRVYSLDRMSYFGDDVIIGGLSGQEIDMFLDALEDGGFDAEFNFR